MSHAPPPQQQQQPLSIAGLRAFDEYALSTAVLSRPLGESPCFSIARLQYVTTFPLSWPDGAVVNIRRADVKLAVIQPSRDASKGFLFLKFGSPLKNAAAALNEEAPLSTLLLAFDAGKLKLTSEERQEIEMLLPDRENRDDLLEDTASNIASRRVNCTLRLLLEALTGPEHGFVLDGAFRVDVSRGGADFRLHSSAKLTRAGAGDANSAAAQPSYGAMLACVDSPDTPSVSLDLRHFAIALWITVDERARDGSWQLRAPISRGTLVLFPRASARRRHQVFTELHADALHANQILRFLTCTCGLIVFPVRLQVPLVQRLRLVLDAGADWREALQKHDAAEAVPDPRAPVERAPSATAEQTGAHGSGLASAAEATTTPDSVGWDGNMATFAGADADVDAASDDDNTSDTRGRTSRKRRRGQLGRSLEEPQSTGAHDQTSQLSLPSEKEWTRIAGHVLEAVNAHVFPAGRESTPRRSTDTSSVTLRFLTHLFADGKTLVASEIDDNKNRALEFVLSDPPDLATVAAATATAAVTNANTSLQNGAAATQEQQDTLAAANSSDEDSIDGFVVPDGELSERGDEGTGDGPGSEGSVDDILRSLMDAEEEEESAAAAHGTSGVTRLAERMAQHRPAAGGASESATRTRTSTRRRTRSSAAFVIPGVNDGGEAGYRTAIVDLVIEATRIENASGSVGPLPDVATLLRDVREEDELDVAMSGEARYSLNNRDRSGVATAFSHGAGSSGSNSGGSDFDPSDFESDDEALEYAEESDVDDGGYGGLAGADGMNVRVEASGIADVGPEARAAAAAAEAEEAEEFERNGVGSSSDDDVQMQMSEEI